MNETVKAILRILEEGKPELQVAAAQILGELRPAEPAVAHALATKLGASEDFLTPFLLDALAAIGSPSAVQVLIGKLESGGAAADRAAHLLGRIGDAATKPLYAAFTADGAEPELQVRLLRILDRRLDRDAVPLLQRALLSPAVEVSEAAAEILQRHAAELPMPQRKALVKQLEKVVAKAGELDAPALCRTLQVLGKLDGEGSKALLLRFTSDKCPATVRHAALRALAGVRLTPAQSRALLELLSDADAANVVRPAMDVLATCDKWDAQGVAELCKVLQRGSEEEKLFALRALRAVPGAEVAKLCLDLLTTGAPAVRAAAAEALANNPAALEPLLKGFVAAKRPDQARTFAEPLASLRDHFTPAQCSALVERATKLLASSDAMGEVVLSLLLAVAPDAARRDLVERAVRLRKARKLQQCLTILLRLAQATTLDHDGRYHLAVTKLLLDDFGPRREHTNGGDATMGHLAALVRDGFPLLERLRKDAQVKPEALLRIASHFCNAVGPERRFGGDVLHYLAEKHARAKAGEEAKLLLRAL